MTLNDFSKVHAMFWPNKSP